MLREGEPAYGCTWTIFFKDFPYQPESSISSIDLASSIQIQLAVEHVQNWTNVRVIDYLGHTFMFSSKMSEDEVVVGIDGVLWSVCEGECEYDYELPVPVVEAIQLFQA